MMILFLLLPSVFAQSAISRFLVSFVNDTAVTFDWLYNLTNPSAGANIFKIEFAIGAYSDDFYLLDTVYIKKDGALGANTISLSYTAANLTPASGYRFRVVPIAPDGPLMSSLPIYVYTRTISKIYWEPIVQKRLELAELGDGFSNPVLGRPYLDSGPEVFTEETRNNTDSFSNPPTSKSPVLPSERRGHSLTSIGKYAFLFGGRTIGYSCTSIYIDNLNFGNTESGRYIYPCTSKQAEVNELWSFDLSTYTWEYLNTSIWNSPPPPPREQHSSINLNGDVFIFGGKSRTFNVSSSGTVMLDYHRDTVYGDLWKLSVERAKAFNLSTPQNGKRHTINQTQPLLLSLDGHKEPAIAAVSDGITPREGLCIDKLTVQVTVTHPCLNQLHLSLRGPGPLTGSPNFFPSSDSEEILLMDRVITNGTGCISGKQSFIFDDDAATSVDTCCVQHFNGSAYRPMSRLATYIGASMTAEWTLVAQDMVLDSLAGAVLSWGISFTSSPCFRRFTWTNLTTHGDLPSPRYGAKTISYGNSFFLIDGRDATDSPIHDLHRFDLIHMKWTLLSPVGVPLPWETASSVGSSFLLSVWGLIRFGGYYRQATLTSALTDSYDASVFLMDPVTLRWQQVQVDPWPLPDGTFGYSSPSSRYLSAAAFISSSQLPWVSSQTMEALYDPVDSTRINFEGTISDSVMIMGGFNGATGSVYDGSSGGLLGDVWMLRLSNWSTAGARYAQQRYLNTHCQWRLRSGASHSSGGCMSSSSGSTCDFKDMIMLAWCSLNNQTVA